MRCLLVADLHYSLQQYDWVTEVAGDFDIVIIAGDHLDLSSMVDFRAQSAVIRKYIAKLTAKTQLLVCSGNHDLDTRRSRREDITVDSRSAGLRRTVRWRLIRFLRYPVHDLPLVRRTDGSRRNRSVVGGGRKKTVEALDLGSPCTAGQFPHELGRRPVSGRCRPGTLDPRIPARFRLVRPRASVAIPPRRIMGRLRRPDMGLQRRASIWTASHARHPGLRATTGVVVLGCGQPDRATRPRPASSRRKADRATRMACSQRPGARSEPGLTSSYC